MIYKDPICSSCKWEVNDKPGAYCKAFPDGIPDEILLGDNDHSEPLPEQKNDLVYAPKVESKKEE